MKSERVLDKLLKQIDNLKLAKRLLEAAYLEMGPYQHSDISQETWTEITNYFKFDDSE